MQENHQRKEVGETKKHQESHYGPDADLFLNPSIKSFVKVPTSTANYILDVGGGGWPVSIQPTQETKTFVYAAYSSTSALAHAKKEAKQVGLTDQQVKLVKADTDFSKIRYKPFHKITSVNQGNNMSNEELVKHFSEMKKALRPEGFILFTTPANLGEVFTTGSLDPTQFKNALSRYNTQVSPRFKLSPQMGQKFLGDLDDIHRATFTQRQNKLLLVTKNKNMFPQLQNLTISIYELQEGEIILRKTPDSLTRNIFHTQEEYKKAMKSTGLTLIKENIECFNSNEERKRYNKTVKNQPKKLLGPEYINQGPFLISLLKKG